MLAADVEWVRNDWGGNFVHGHVGFDKQGRPIIYKRFGSFIPSNVLSTVGLKAFMRYQARRARGRAAGARARARALSLGRALTRAPSPPAASRRSVSLASRAGSQVWVNEQAIMMLNAQTSATRYNIETWNMILNLDGLSWSQMQLDALKVRENVPSPPLGTFPLSDRALSTRLRSSRSARRSPRSRRATTPSGSAR